MPLATKVVSGEQADDGLYLPILEQVRQNLGQSGLLWVGDCKMSSQETRGYIHRQQDYYLTPHGKVKPINLKCVTQRLVRQALQAIFFYSDSVDNSELFLSALLRTRVARPRFYLLAIANNQLLN